MPWLAGTALLHSLAVTEQRASFKAWTLTARNQRLLALSAGDLSWCVPACWSRYTRLPPTRHAACLSSPLWCWSLAARCCCSPRVDYKVRSRVNNALWSRESLLLGEQRSAGRRDARWCYWGRCCRWCTSSWVLGSISIGAPFFNTMFTWLMAPFALLLGIGPLVRWGRDRPRKIRRLLVIACVSARWRCRCCCRGWFEGDKIVAMTVLGLAMACWVCGAGGSGSCALRVSRGARTTLSYWGMVAGSPRAGGRPLWVSPLARTTAWSATCACGSGDSVDVHEYRFTFREVKEVTGPNWRCAVVATIGVTRRWQAGNGAVCGKTLLQHCRVDDDRSGG